jgi:hypothetical protein
MGAGGKWHTGNKVTIWRWREAYQNDFSARMDWTIKPVAEANQPPVARIKHAGRLTAKAGERVSLSAEGSSDPDGNALSYSWIFHGEPSTAPLSTSRSGAPRAIEDAAKPDAWFTAPKVAKPETLHFILAVTDSGSPRLTR